MRSHCGSNKAMTFTQPSLINRGQLKAFRTIGKYNNNGRLLLAGKTSFTCY